MMTDDRIEEASRWCLRLVEGRMGGSEQERFRTWLEDDPRNAAAFDEVIRTWQAFDGPGAAPSLVAMRREALSRLDHRQDHRWYVLAVTRRVALATMAACLVLAAAGLAVWLHLKPQAYRTGVGERQLVRLEDGSQLSLDADTHVEVRYSRDRRELVLAQGRARFQVARDPLKPFSVSAGGQVVVATGTEFSVELLAGEIHVLLYEGSVEVLSRDAAGRMSVPSQAPALGGADIAGRPKLLPGQELIAHPDAGETRIRDIDSLRARAWERGQLSFNDEPLAKAVERMNRYAGPRLAVADDGSGQLRISGTFLAGDSAAFVEGVTGVFPVRARDEDGVIVLTNVRSPFPEANPRSRQ